MNKLLFLFSSLCFLESCLSLQQANPSSKYNIIKTESIQIDSNKAIISGYVREDEKNEPLFESYVVIQNTTTGVATDWNGFFKITLKPDEYRFIIGYVGFHPVTTRKIKLLPNTKTELLVKLHESSIRCD